MRSTVFSRYRTQGTSFIVIIPNAVGFRERLANMCSNVLVPYPYACYLYTHLKKIYIQVHKEVTFFSFLSNRDNIYRLDLEDLKKIEAAQWPATEKKVEMCLVKGQSADNCHNYVKVLLSAGKRLFACGTGAFSPQCTWREVSVYDFYSSPKKMGTF